MGRLWSQVSEERTWSGGLKTSCFSGMFLKYKIQSITTANDVVAFARLLLAESKVESKLGYHQFHVCPTMGRHAVALCQK